MSTRDCAVSAIFVTMSPCQQKTVSGDAIMMMIIMGADCTSTPCYNDDDDGDVNDDVDDEDHHRGRLYRLHAIMKLCD